MKAKGLKVTISGSYRTHEFKIIDFGPLKGVIPYTSEELALMHIRGRYARMWIMNSKDCKESLVDTRVTHVDDLVECEHDFSYLGKDIREMTQEELQDLASAKDLRLIPQYKKGDVREARTRAYAAYSEQVLKKVIKYKEEGFNLMKQPPIIVTDGSWRRDSTRKLTNEESLDAASTIGKTTSPLKREELEEIAANQNIAFPENISDDELYKKIYGVA